MPVTVQGWEVFSTSSGSNSRTGPRACSIEVNRDCITKATMEPRFNAWKSYSYCFPSLYKSRGNEIVLWMAYRQRDNSVPLDKKGQLVAFFKIVKSDFPIYKTFLKADLFPRNWKTSTLLLWKEDVFSLLRSFDIRLIISVICMVVAPNNPRGRLEAALPGTVQKHCPRKRAPEKQTRGKQLCKMGLSSQQKS